MRPFGDRHERSVRPQLGSGIKFARESKRSQRPWRQSNGKHSGLCQQALHNLSRLTVQ